MATEIHETTAQRVERLKREKNPWFDDVLAVVRAVAEIFRDADALRAYYFCVGGGVGDGASLARAIGYRCAAVDVPDAIERLLRAFLEHRREAETVRAFLARHADDDIRLMLGGSAAVLAERDLPVAAPPHGLEG